MIFYSVYESKKAPEELKETARQHPRENPVITETNVLSVLPTKHDAEHEQKDCTGSNTENPVISEKNVLSDVKPSDSDKTTVTEPISPSKTVTETVTEKLAPAYAKVSDATHAITKKIQDMAFPESTEPEAEVNDVSEINTAGTNQPAGFNTKVLYLIYMCYLLHLVSAFRVKCIIQSSCACQNVGFRYGTKAYR